MHKIRFYGHSIDTPLGVVLNSPAWAGSTLDRLNEESKGQVYLKAIFPQYRTAAYCWRVVNAQWSQEDSVVTRFFAYDLDGNALPAATFGVAYGGLDSMIAGGFKYPPENGNRYYIPADNQIVTPNDGGYTVVVLDLENPSEGMAFGMHKGGAQHKTLNISFRLFPMTKDYPNG